MLRKEILIICLIICCLFSLGAVAAASDGNATDDVISIDNNVSAYSLPDTDTEILAGNDNADTFSALKEKLDQGGVITLEKNYTYDSASDQILSSGINVPTTVTKIQGNGKLIIIDGSNLARMFNISSGHNIVISGITFSNGYATEGNGGSINSLGTLTIENCNF
jgi:hypothetical protein